MKNDRDLINNIKYCASKIEATARLIRTSIDNWEHPRVTNEIDEYIKKLTKYIVKIMGEWEWLKESRRMELEE